LNNFLV